MQLSQRSDDRSNNMATVLAGPIDNDNAIPQWGVFFVAHENRYFHVCVVRGILGWLLEDKQEHTSAWLDPDTGRTMLSCAVLAWKQQNHNMRMASTDDADAVCRLAGFCS